MTFTQQRSSASMAKLAGLVTFLCLLAGSANGVAGANLSKPARRMLQLFPQSVADQFGQLTNCADPGTSCPLPITALTALEFNPGCVPGTAISAPAGIYVIVCGYVTGSGFSTDTENTALWKEVSAGAGFISFDVTLTGSRYHYAHVAAHCADLVANVNYQSAVSLPACVNPDGLVFLVVGVYNAAGGPQTVALLQVVPAAAP